MVTDANNDILMPDNDKIYFGSSGSSDASIYWDATNLQIGTAVSALPIKIGHGTSEVTFGDNVTIAGNLTVTGNNDYSDLVAGDIPTLNQSTTGSAASLSATLAVGSGGTGVTSKTGTGNVVLSSSPTLVTPALGTPASGVLTNCTGTASNLVAGTANALDPTAISGLPDTTIADADYLMFWDADDSSMKKVDAAELTSGGGGGGIAIASGDTNNYVMTSDGTGDSIVGESLFTFDSTTGDLAVGDVNANIILGGLHPGQATSYYGIKEGVESHTGIYTTLSVATDWIANIMTGAVVAIATTDITFKGGICTATTAP
tara:strand:- start:664 stop:1614 length:951 start_codon:yes stop_codon:yes gene_type:complete